MTNTDVIKKLIGSIEPIGCSKRDSDRFENLKEMCDVVRNLISEIEYVALYNTEAYEASVVKARDFAFNFLSGELEIEYTHDQKGELL